MREPDRQEKSTGHVLLSAFIKCAYSALRKSLAEGQIIFTTKDNDNNINRTQKEVARTRDCALFMKNALAVCAPSAPLGGRLVVEMRAA